MMNLEEYAGFPLIDAGDYEVVLKAEIKQAKNNNSDYLSAAFKIRDDVEQKFKNSTVFENIYRDTDNPKWFDLRRCGSILVTQKGKEGYKNEFEDVEEYVQYINGIHLIVSVEVVFDENLNKNVNRIVRRSYKPSKWDADHPEAANGVHGKNLDSIEMTDDDLPF